jgi:hypothetical protein
MSTLMGRRIVCLRFSSTVGESLAQGCSSVEEPSWNLPMKNLVLGFPPVIRARETKMSGLPIQSVLLRV